MPNYIALLKSCLEQNTKIYMYRDLMKMNILLILFASLSVVTGSGLIDVELDGTTPIPSTPILDTKFAIFRKKLTWEKAYEYCHTCIGKFATFPDVETANLVRNKIYELSVFSKEYDEAKIRKEFGLDRRYWFGLRDQFPTEGEWQWIGNPGSEGVVVYQKDLMEYPWYPRQPDHSATLANNNEHCAGFWNPGYYYDEYKISGSGSELSKKEKHTFNDFPCNNKYYFLCEKSDPPPPTADQCKTLQSFGRSMGKKHGKLI